MNWHVVRLSAVVALGVGAAVGCTRDAWIGSELPRGRDAGPTEPDARPPGSDTRPPEKTDSGSCHVVLCGGPRPLACGDCMDNDGDGKIDMHDPDCLGPCQNDEKTFANPMPGQGHGSCTLDCYFDQDNGLGNDDCEWSHACDPLSVAPDYPPEGIACALDLNHKLTRGETCASITAAGQSAKCNSVCGPLTPNGCDCFGCCSFPGAAHAVFIGSVDAQGTPTCDSEHIADPMACKPCTQVLSCANPCDACEICFGKRTLDASCMGGAPACGALLQSCGLDGLPECPAGLSCITGCCEEPPR